ncbi:MAG TPA: hypothetical protein PLN25_00475 [Deltaproteobacteria bacterium]|nr:hypothetical protein [Deltaproteobacteria bacterium]HQB39993.1 hypothetical protein [Deltaproteobacteria bacterium]
MGQFLERDERRVVFKIVAAYTAFGSLWILLSDSIMAFLVRDPDTLTRISTYKGLFISLPPQRCCLP